MPGLDTYTKLLVHSDGSDGSAAVTDSGYRSAMGGTQPGGHLPTLAGAAVISSTQSKFGGSSLYLEGTTSYVTIPDSEDWNWGTGLFTIDCWVRMTTTTMGGNFFTIASQATTGNWYWAYIDNNTISFNFGDGGGTLLNFTYLHTFAADTWYHLAVARVALANANTDWIASIDGVVQTGAALTKVTGAWNATFPNYTGGLIIGAVDTTPNHPFPGYIDEFRVSKGIARWTSTFTVPSAAYTADGKTNLLLHFDAADTPFTGSTPKVGTFVGTAQHKPNDAAVAMIGNGSLALDGNSDYVTVPDSTDWDLGNTFTIDCWVNSSALTGDIVSRLDSASIYWSFYYNAATSKLQFDCKNTKRLLLSLTGTWTPTANAWHHIALVRNGTTSGDWYMFIDGVSQAVGYITSGDYDVVIPDCTDPLNIGKSQAYGYYLGYIDELRICKGTAVWTADFIPSIVPYTNTTAANTKLLCHFDNYQIDSSASPHALTQAGTAYNTGDYVIGATSPAVGAGAWRFDGTDDKITYPDAADWAFGAGNFTIDFWVKFLGVTNGGFFSQYVDNTHKLALGFDGSNLVFYDYNGGYVFDASKSWAPVINTWYHVAVVRNGNTQTSYINGVSIGTTDFTGITMTDYAATADIGTYNNGNWLNGYIDNFRVLKGTAAWTTTFTPPTTAYSGSDIPTSGNGIYLSFDYDGSDSGGSAHVPTYVGNTYGATAQSRFTGSVLYDGNSDYITFPDSADWSMGTDPFTIDCWVKWNSTNGGVIASQYTDTTTFWHFYWNGTNLIISNALNNSFVGRFYIYTAWAPALKTWYHIAVVRVDNGNTSASWRLYIDGVSQTLSLLAGSWNGTMDDYAKPLWVGVAYAGTYFDGYMDELRISKGIARWTSNFTPQTFPYAGAYGPAGVKKVAGVTLANANKVEGVSVANIKKLMGVS